MDTLSYKTKSANPQMVTKAWRSFVPDFVREVGVGGHDIDLGTGFLEGGVVVRRVFDLGGAVEGESGGHENQHVPLAFEALFGDFDELSILESLCFERLDLGIDQGHGASLC